MARKGVSVTAGDSKSLRFVNRIPVIGFHMAKDQPLGIIRRAWGGAYYLKKNRTIFSIKLEQISI